MTKTIARRFGGFLWSVYRSTLCFWPAKRSVSTKLDVKMKEDYTDFEYSSVSDLVEPISVFMKPEADFEKSMK